MRNTTFDAELLLEIGLGTLGALLLGGIALLLYGRARGAVHHGRGRAVAPPARGSVPAGRHQNVSTVASR